MSNEKNGGKGSKRRTAQVPAQKFADNWDAIFKKKAEKKKVKS